MAYNPMDDMILEDPAYMTNGGSLPNAPGGLSPRDALIQQGGPVIQNLREQFPQIDQMKEEYTDIAAKNLSGLVAPFYNFMSMGTDAYNKQKQINKDVIQNQLVGFPEDVKPGSLDAIRLISSNAPAYMDFLKNEGYDTNVNILREVQNLFFVPTRDVLNKLSSGEAQYTELSKEERGLVDPLVIALDMFDVGLLTNLARKGFTSSFVNFIKDAKSKGRTSTEILTEAYKQFPEETPRAVTFFMGEQKGVNFAPMKGDGPGGMSPASLENLKRGASASQESLYQGYRQALDKFKATNPDIFNAGTFYDFLKQEGVPLTISLRQTRSPRSII